MPKGYKCSVSCSSLELDEIFVVLPSDTITIRKEIESKIRERYELEEDLRVEYSEVNLEVLPITRLSARDIVELMQK